MGGFYKNSAKRIEYRQVVAERNKEVYSYEGTKLDCAELLEIFKSGGVILDLRNPIEYMGGGVIHNSINVPHTNAVKWINGNKSISKNTPILLYSTEGKESAVMKLELEANPYRYLNVTNIGSHRWYPSCS